ncbi:MAG: response regulator [Proteobacteria bacterium]|nr:response regulator [Pseudomonadota bacterium]
MTNLQKQILVIDDEIQIRRFLKIALEPHGFNVTEAETGQKGLVAATTCRPDLIILDLGLPDMQGMTVLKRLREWYERPIIILSVRNDEESIISALDSGADDYLTKPFGIGELLARMRLATRKTSTTAEPVVSAGDLQVDIASRKVTRAGQELKLTATEFALLTVLIRNIDKVMTHTQILKEIWGPNSSEHVQYIRVYVGHLRQKIEMDPSQPRHIVTEPGIGYRFQS